MSICEDLFELVLSTSVLYKNTHLSKLEFHDSFRFGVLSPKRCPVVLKFEGIQEAHFHIALTMASASDWPDLISSLQVAAKSWGGFNWDSKSQLWDSTATQSKEAREQSLAARKQLAETTKQFKKSVKNVEQAGTTLGSSNTDDNATAAVKAIELLAKNCRQTVKAYQGKSRISIDFDSRIKTLPHCTAACVNSFDAQRKLII